MAPHNTNHLDSVRKLLKAGQIDAATHECESILGENPADFETNILLGQCLHRADRQDEAAAAFRRAAQTIPGHALPYQSLANLYHARGNLPEAVKHYERALEIDPAWVTGWLDLGVAYQATGKLQQAAGACRKAINIAPGNAVAHNNLGSFLQQSGELDGAMTSFQKAVELDPFFVDALYNLGLLHSSRRNRDKAIMYFQRTLELQPGREDAIVGLAGMLERKGEVDQAYELLRPLVNDETSNTYMLINFSQVCTSLGRHDEAIAPLEKQLTRTGLYRREKIQIHFALGKIYDKQEDYGMAFNHYRQGNDLEPVHFDRTGYQAWVTDVIEIYHQNFLQRAPRATNRSGTPVFIIATPRSGTSLVEQILSSHPLVYGAGETGDIAHGSAKLHPLIRDGLITAKNLDEFANSHLAHLNARGDGASRVIDKTVNSFMHLGLIQLLFPNARIIHCMRNPLDTCLSCYFSKLGSNHPYSYNLEDLAMFYRQYHRIMQHWKQALDLKVMEIRYEDLVHDLEAGARSMLEFLDLDWDPACLDYHKTNRKVTTISYDQVRRPIYTSSANRWKNYSEHIGVLKDALSDLIYDPSH